MVVAFAVLAALMVGVLAVPTTAAPMVVVAVAATTDVVPCDTDSDCAARNPDVAGYGVAPTSDPNSPVTVYSDGWASITFDRSTEDFRVALLKAGFIGNVGDRSDSVIWAPVWAVMDVPGGTWTVTPNGGARCVDFWTTEGKECSDGTFLPWHPDYIGDVDAY
jgi:hypothetical protein